MSVDPERHKFLFRVGIALLALNIPIGWGGGALCVFLAGLTRRRDWLLVGLWVYGLSWLVLGLGFWLAGPAGGQIARRFWHRRRKLKNIRLRRAKRRSASLPQ